MRTLLIPLALIMLPLSCGQKKDQDAPRTKTRASQSSIKNRTSSVKIDPPGNFEANAKELVARITAHDYAGVVAMFNKAVAEKLPSVKLKVLWERIEGLTGRYRSIRSLTKVQKGKYQVFTIKLLFEKMLWELIISFDTHGKVAGLFNRPGSTPWTKPTYVNSAAYKEHRLRMGTKGWQLPATISIPEGKGPFPGVVLVHGSGPSDRDATIHGNKPFKDLALGLASRGVAVIRYDKRTKVYGKKMVQNKMAVTLEEETVQDALVALAQLQKEPRVSPAKVYILGHSLGGYAVPLIASRAQSAAGFVMMAPSAVHPARKIVDQLTYLASLSPKRDPAFEATIATERRRMAIVTGPGLTPATPATDLPLGSGTAAYWLYINNYKHLDMVRQISRPLLLLQGARDYQVTVEKDLALWKEAVKGMPNVTIKICKRCNHLFIPGSGTPSNEEYLTTGHVQREVIDDLAAFITSK